MTLTTYTPTTIFQAFNALSLYRAFSTYLRVTGDTSSPFFAAAQAYMVQLRDFWKAYARPSAPTLADYSANPNNYLECLSTYRHVTAGLQGGNAYMLMDFADLLDATAPQGGAAGALRDLARSIAQDTLVAAYVSNTTSGSVGNNGSSVGDWGGWWKCVDVQGGGQTPLKSATLLTLRMGPWGLQTHGGHLKGAPSLTLQ